jgi:polyketide synthase PksN
MDGTSKGALTSPLPGGQSVQDWLVRSLAEILLIEENELDLEEPFTGLGLDSVIGVEWVQVINRRFGLKVPATKVYDHPNVPAFTRYIEEEIRKRGSTGPSAEVGKARLEALSMDEILELVRKRMLDIEEANQLIDGLLDRDERGGKP